MEQVLTVEMLKKRLNNGHLDLSSLRLEHIPLELMCRCVGHERGKQIYSVDFSNNLLRSFPSQFCLFFSGVEVLNLRANKITKLPENIGTLTHLVRLDISRNRIKKLPNSFADLESLRYLNISNNAELDLNLAELLGNCASAEECANAATIAVQYAHFSATLSSEHESTAITEDSEEIGSSASSTNSEVLQRRGYKRNWPLGQHKSNQRRNNEQRAATGTQTETNSTSFRRTILLFVLLLVSLVALGVPVWLTLDSIRESCATNGAASTQEERRFCAQIELSFNSASVPAPIGQFIGDFAALFQKHWSKAVNGPLMRQLPPGISTLGWWQRRAGFAVWTFWQIFGPLFTFLSDYFAHLWLAYVVPAIQQTNHLFGV